MSFPCSVKVLTLAKYIFWASLPNGFWLDLTNRRCQSDTGGQEKGRSHGLSPSSSRLSFGFLAVGSVSSVALDLIGKLQGLNFY